MRALRAALLDMGGVLLDFSAADGLPAGRADFRGREALLSRLRDGGPARLSQDDLERLLYAPWRRDYARRYETGREADWHPHLARLRRFARRRFSDRTLLSTWFDPYGETVEALPGAVAAVGALGALGLDLALVSNVPLPGEHYRRVLARHGLVRPFAALCFSYDEGTRKPSPALLQRALAALGVRPEEAIMVGDRRSADVAAGRAAGVATVWLRSTDVAGPQPDLELGRLAELPAALAGGAFGFRPRRSSGRERR